MRNKLCSTMGVELTYLHKMRKRNPIYTYDLIRKMQCLPYYNLGKDGINCIEISSQPLKTILQFKKWYDKVDRKARSLELRPTYDEFITHPDCDGVYYGTGGGHIHVGIDLSNITLVINILRFVADRPWLNWIFNETCDTKNATALINIPRIRYNNPQMSADTVSLFLNEHVRYALYNDKIYTRSNQCSQVLDKRYALATDNNTIEFRFFDAPKNWQQLKEHLLFTDAIVRYCIKEAKKHKLLPKVKYKSIKHWKKLNPDIRRNVKTELKNTCGVLGIDYSPYLKYLRNLDGRMREGYELV